MTIHPSGVGRYAPSPSGDLHLGNLRTAMLAWLCARSTGRRFVMRMEDLDRAAEGSAQRQLDDLAALGIDWDGEVIYQSDRQPDYLQVIADLTDRGLTYECFCTRREILAAPSAPHAPDGAYPGTCRSLTEAQRQERRDSGRPPAIRLRVNENQQFTIDDAHHGRYTGTVDDFVLLRGDRTPAYNLAVVVDDAASGIDQVVRGDDLLSSAPRQAFLADLLGHRPPQFVHVPMVLNQDGVRLAKRDGAVTLRELNARGVATAHVRRILLSSVGLPDNELPSLVKDFDIQSIPTTAWLLDPSDSTLWR